MTLSHRFPRDTARSGLRVLLGVCCLCGAGCSMDNQSDDQRLEHTIPEHRPATFEETVEALRVRREQLQQEHTHGHDPQKLAELRDIVRWLPDIAADSDLLRPEWEQVQRHSIDLENLCTQLVSMTNSEQDEIHWYQIVDDLESLVPAATGHDSLTKSPPLHSSVEHAISPSNGSPIDLDSDLHSEANLEEAP